MNFSGRMNMQIHQFRNKKSPALVRVLGFFAGAIPSVFAFVTPEIGPLTGCPLAEYTATPASLPGHSQNENISTFSALFVSASGQIYIRKK
jgi:hypothetical protein